MGAAVTVRDNPEASRYEILDGDELAGFLVCRRDGDVLTMVHTEVQPEREGQGVGSELARGALDDVRAQGLRVQPLCPFVSAWIRRHPDYADLVSSAS